MPHVCSPGSAASHAGRSNSLDRKATFRPDSGSHLGLVNDPGPSPDEHPSHRASSEAQQNDLDSEGWTAKASPG